MSLILIANNYTHDPEGKRILERPDGSADYRVWVAINHRPIFEGMVPSHCRHLGAAALLHSIATQMEVTTKKPVRRTNIGRPSTTRRSDQNAKGEK